MVKTNVRNFSERVLQDPRTYLRPELRLGLKPQPRAGKPPFRPLVRNVLF